MKLMFVSVDSAEGEPRQVSIIADGVDHRYTPTQAERRLERAAAREAESLLRHAGIHGAIDGDSVTIAAEDAARARELLAPHFEVSPARTEENEMRILTTTQAITESIMKTRIVHLHHPSAEDIAELKRLAEGSVATRDEDGPLTEYWGKDQDGDAWRVHAHSPAA